MPDARIEFDADLHHALGPAPLLRFEGVDLHWNFRGRFFIEQVDKFPAHQLRTKTQVGIFSECVVLPAAAHVDGFTPPDAGGTVEVKKTAAAIASRLLNHKM